MPRSLEEVHGQVVVQRRGLFRRLFAFFGPAYLVSVGYMDPGNWATDIEAGSRFGYTLIWVLLMSNLMAVLLQTLSARLGIVAGRDLAQACRQQYPRPIAMFLWILCEIAIAATDLAEVLGTVLGLNLLFGLPLLWGCLVTAFDTILLLAIQRLGVRKMEAFILSLVGTIGACFVVEIFLAKPDWGAVGAGFVPHLESGALYVAIGMLGATVMPHNLYLHSALVQTRRVARSLAAKRQACLYNLIDSAVALNAAFFVNAAILVMAAADFGRRGIVVTEIQQAHQMLGHLLGTALAPIAFGLALLCAGQSSTLTGTLAGQVVMEGFVRIRMRPWLRRLMTRAMALGPAVIVIVISGDHGTYQLLILSQVILSLQLPFAIIPLIHFTSDSALMGRFANRWPIKALAWIVAGIVVGLNAKLVYDELGRILAGETVTWMWLVLKGLILLGVLAVVAGLSWITILPWLRRLRQRRAMAGEVSAATIGDLDLAPKPIARLAVALERTEVDRKPLERAAALAEDLGAELILLHVSDSVMAQVYGDEAGDPHSVQDERYLEQIAEALKQRGVKTSWELLYGSPAEQLVKFIRQSGVDLLIMGAHGHRGLADIIHGTTIGPVRHALSVPVMVVPTEASSAKAGSPAAEGSGAAEDAPPAGADPGKGST